MKNRYRCIFPLLLASFFTSFSVSAQYNFDTYTPLRSAGKLPDDLLILSSEKYQKEKATLTGKEKRFDRKSKEYFLMESNFRLRELLFKGKILFNDPVGLYINRVADKLLEKQPQLRKELRFYAVKSSSVNAFATNDGMVFINLGLIAQLETESQLAFILAHEITHYTKKHVINQYVVDQKIEHNKKGYASLSAEEKMLTSNNFSRELETEADLEGTSIYLNSAYSTSHIKGVFNVLQYSYLPFDDSPFRKTFFESSDFTLPADYFLATVKPIASTEQYDESKSTHPSIAQRRESILKKIENTVTQDKKDYLVSEEEFKLIRKLARYELSTLYMSGLAYEKAIYNAYLLLEENPNSLYLQKTIAKALYGLTKYANEGAYEKVHEEFEETEGNSQQVIHLFDKLKPKELNVLAIKYFWHLKKRFPHDQELASLGDELLKDLILKHYESDQDFLVATQGYSPILTANTITDSTKYQQLNKYEKIDYQQSKEKKAADSYFIRSAFIENFKEQEFSATYKRFVEEKHQQDAKNKETSQQKNLRLKQEKKEKKRQARLERKKGVALGINKLVIIHPFYYKIDERKKKSLRYLDSESAQISLDEKIKSNARLAELDISLLSQHSFTATDAEKFNDYAFLRSWVSERIQHLEASVPMSGLDGESVSKLIEKYGTKYYCWTGIIDTREKKENIASTLLYTAVVYPLLPFGIYYAVTPAYHTYHFTLVFNLETGKPEYASIRHIDKKSSVDVLNSAIYDTFYQFKNRR